MRISIEQARRHVLEHTSTLGAEEVDLDDALGRVLAQDAVAPNPVPPFDCSTMDGFALRAGDTDRAPAHLTIVDEARAGSAAGAHVDPGTAVRISTGAPIPDGADAVVRQELTSTEDGTVTVEEAIAAGTDVRVAGGDIPVGSTVLKAGTLLTGPEIGVLAAVNIARPAVVRRPRIALVSTGDELIDPGGPLKPGQIRDANSFALSAAARFAGAELISRVKVGDDREATVAALDKALRDTDILVTIGGVSVGPHDHVRPALEALGAREVFCRVSLRPGGQICFFVTDDGTLVFALPGNPVSATIAFRLFVVAAIDALLGRGARAVRRTTATAAVELPGRLGRTTAVRCHTELREDGWYVAPSQSHQDSHVMTSLLDVDAFAFVPEDRESLAAGERVEIEFVR
jgi:molybdopterin molybdotransferase